MVTNVRVKQCTCLMIIPGHIIRGFYLQLKSKECMRIDGIIYIMYNVYHVHYVGRRKSISALAGIMNQFLSDIFWACSSN